MEHTGKRILILEFREETNTFNPLPAEMANFRAKRYYEGLALLDFVADLPTELHGMIDAIKEIGGEIVPGISLYSGSAGVVKKEVYDLMAERTAYYIRKEGPFDGVFLSLHGATVAEEHTDACGDLLEFIRKLTGPETVIVASFDLHANLTEKILGNVNALSAYQSYPHVDFYETGFRAGKLGMRILAGEPVFMASVPLPVLVPPSGYSSLNGPFKDVIDYGKSLMEDGTLLDFTVTQVQPWMDIPVISGNAIAIAADRETALWCADSLAEKLFDIRDLCRPEMMTLDEIIDLAEKPDTQKPVILADAADSPNGGAVGDSVAEALRLYERRSHLRSALFVKDPETVRKAFEVGVGNSAEFEIGGKITPGMPGPLRATGTVRTLSDGDFRQEGPAGKGSPCHIGKTAVISVGPMDIMVCERPMASGDPQIFRHFGIEPKLYDLVVVKANTSFLVPYGPIAGRICFADTPGAGAPNLRRLPFHNLPHPMYPFDLPEDFRPEKAKIRQYGK